VRRVQRRLLVYGGSRSAAAVSCRHTQERVARRDEQRRSVRGLSTRDILLGGGGGGDTVRSRYVQSECECSDVYKLRVGHVPGSPEQHDMQGMSCRLALRSGRERASAVRGWQLSQHDGCDGPTRLCRLSSGFGVPDWCAYTCAMRARHNR
jgi:hypothetical protein